MSKTVSLSEIKTKDTLQPRMSINFLVVYEYAEAMKEGQSFPPLEVVWDGENYWLWDGFHRKDAAKEAEIETISVNITEGTLEDAEWLALSANKVHGFNRTNEDKRRAIELSFEHPNGQGKSSLQIAKHVGVSTPMVIKYRPDDTRISKNLNELNLHESSYTRQTINGQMRVFTKPSLTADIAPALFRPLLEETEIPESKTEVEALSQFQPEKQQKVVDKIASGEARTVQEAVEIIPGLSQPMAVLLSHETVEYYTPQIYIDAARKVMGGIDLDPASSKAAQENIKAGTFYTEHDNGLSHEWIGRVWLNPPYSKTGGRSNQEIWAQRLIEEFEQSNVTEAHLLVKSALGYKWFENLWDKLPGCFVRDRLSFIKSNGSNDGESKHGTAIFYLGKNLNLFIEVFSAFGRITAPDGQYINKRTEKT